MVRCPSVIFHRRCSQCSNIFFFETAVPIKARLYLKPPWIGGTKSFRGIWIARPKWPPCPCMVKSLQKSYVCMYAYILAYIYIFYMLKLAFKVGSRGGAMVSTSARNAGDPWFESRSWYDRFLYVNIYLFILMPVSCNTSNLLKILNSDTVEHL